MIALAPAVRAAFARVPRHGAVAGGVGALLASIAIVLVSPLSLAGGVRGQEGASLFAADLAVYRAAPPDIRSASLVAAAAAGYEDRAFFRRPGWIPPLSPSGLVRAVVRNLRGIPQGGSTIPQQLAKLYLRTGRRVGVLDKLEEAMFATWLVRQGAPEEVAGLYLNLSAGTAMGTVRRPADGLHRLSLALFGLPLRRLSREDQLVLGASPRGVQWLRAHPAISSRRIAATREWLIAQNLWDASVRSYLDDFDVDSAAAFRFVEGWTERVASGEAATADLDLVAAIDRFREGLSETLQAQFRGTARPMSRRRRVRWRWTKRSPVRSTRSPRATRCCSRRSWPSEGPICCGEWRQSSPPASAPLSTHRRTARSQAICWPSSATRCLPKRSRPSCPTAPPAWRCSAICEIVASARACLRTGCPKTRLRFSAIPRARPPSRSAPTCIASSSRTTAPAR